MTKNCKACGAEIDVAAKYCKYCGAENPEMGTPLSNADVMSAGASSGVSYAANTTRVAEEAFGTEAKSSAPVVAFPASGAGAAGAAADPYAGYVASPKMTFSESFNSVLHKYADFKGRARRSEYWWWALVSGIVSGIGSSFSNAYTQNGGLINGLFTFVFFLLSLAIVVPSIAVAVRRLHDLGKSGWFYLFCLIPLVGPIILIVWFVGDGKPEENMYGPSPKYTRTY